MTKASRHYVTVPPFPFLKVKGLKLGEIRESRVTADDDLASCLIDGGNYLYAHPTAKGYTFFSQDGEEDNDPRGIIAALETAFGVRFIGEHDGKEFTAADEALDAADMAPGFMEARLRAYLKNPSLRELLLEQICDDPAQRQECLERLAAAVNVTLQPAAEGGNEETVRY